MPGWIGLPELLVLLVVVLLLFGPKRLPEMGRSLGRGMREFKDSVSGNDKHDEDRHAEPIAALPASTPTPDPVARPAEPAAAPLAREDDQRS